VRRFALVLVGVVVALPATAHAAAPVAEIRTGEGMLVGDAGVGPYQSPRDYGYLLTIGSSQRDAGGLVLQDVSILGGRIRIVRMYVPASGTAGARIDGLQVAGRYAKAAPNTVLQVGDGSYAVFLQEAALPGRLGTDLGLVGVRVVSGDRQILVGLARAATPGEARRGSPWLLFGLAPLATVGGPSLMTVPALPQGGGPGERAVAIAERFLGVRYVWGGSSPFSGFDCSGLVMYVYEQLGIHLTHFSGAQWNEGTRILTPDDLAPGDLVFFHRGPSGPGHVGIYVGGSDFIHAPHSGDVVRISSLYESSYSFSYIGAVRPY
jgi:cell wall-associated NlpC family hydrolase